MSLPSNGRMRERRRNKSILCITYPALYLPLENQTMEEIERARDERIGFNQVTESQAGNVLTMSSWKEGTNDERKNEKGSRRMDGRGWKRMSK